MTRTEILSIAILARSLLKLDMDFATKPKNSLQGKDVCLGRRARSRTVSAARLRMADLEAGEGGFYLTELRGSAFLGTFQCLVDGSDQLHDIEGLQQVARRAEPDPIHR